ncbi:MAG: glutamate synthase-related protein [Gemmataceae bacterium]
MFDGRQLIRQRKYLYSDTVGRDACGIGGVAARDGKPTHEVLKKTVLGLRNVEHRGGICGDAGDGAGLICQIPHAFFKEEAKRLKLAGARDLKPEHRLAVGVVFFQDAEDAKREQARSLIQEVLAEGPMQWLGWRPVPTRHDALPALARASEPVVEQLLLRVHGEPAEAEAFLYRARLELRHRFRETGLTTYIPSLSALMVGYKGLLTSPQLIDYYPDLSNDQFETGLALFHRRYSTNTYPNWTLAQPFRLLCHNGEINTIRTTRNAVHAYAHGLEPALPGRDLLTAGGSDSAGLDEWVEHLVRTKGWSLLRALRVTIPPVWDSEADYWGQEAVDLFTYCRRTYGSLCAWDGPAGIVASDGRVLAGLVDRMGLRPVRWCSDDRGWLYIGSESGIYGLDTTKIVASGQLQPGQMIALDTATGERLDSHQILARVVDEAREELGDIHELNRSHILVPESFDFVPALDETIGDELEQHHWTVDHLLQAHGWDFERAQAVKEMAKLRKEPLSSMGFDRVLTVFSAHHPTLFKYLQQTFAEVTNPPIDPYREGGAMSLVTYLGRPAAVRDASQKRDTDESFYEASRTEGELPCRQMELSAPVLSDAVLEEVRRHEVLGYQLLSAVFPLRGGADALRESLHRLRSDAERAVHAGFNVLCVSHKEAFHDGLVPIPSLLALAAVHNYLCHQGLRDRCSLVVQAGDVQEGHDIACLVAFGADAVHPYLMLRLIRNGLTFKDPDTKQEWSLSARECLENLFAAIEDSLKKIVSKMGITTVEGYRGAMLFEAVGFGPELMEFMGPVPSRIGGIGFKALIEDAAWRIEQAEKMTVLGRNRDYHAFNSKVRMALRKAATADAGGGESAYARRLEQNVTATGLSKEYVDFSNMVNHRTPTVLRDLFLLKRTSTPTPISDVQPAIDIVQRCFHGAAMSHGALTRDSHQTLAAAFNDLDALSNSGEGGEARFRNDAPERAWGPFWEKTLAERADDPELCLNGDVRKSRLKSRIRQVASGRFGVDAEYLVNADEIQIKMAQGAKPGEGGQLMGKKVTKEIAEIRYARPGTDLISPPPHHDIYSIEDLAQLIHDLKAVKPGVPVSVKLVAVENVGTIAVGVAKAGADVIEMDGIDGGTGAAMASSKEHAGLPSEMGLSEAHQALVLNGLRKAVKLRVGGGIKNGYDVVKYALLGADEFSFGQALMVSVGCIVCKSCHIPNCPTGITGTQGEYKGTPDHTKAYLLSVAEETRQLLAQLGAKSVGEIVGRSELLVPSPSAQGRAKLVDVSRFLHPDMALTKLDAFPIAQTARGVCATGGTLNDRMVDSARDAIEAAASADLMFRIRNSDRSVGATLAGLIAKLYGREGMPNGKRIKVRFDGEAGQSFGAWCLDLARPGTPRLGAGRRGQGHLRRRGHGVARLHGQRLRRRTAERGRQQRGLWRNRRHRVRRRPGRPPPRHPQFRGPHRRGSGGQVCVRVHDPRPGGHPRAGRERDWQRHDRRRAVRVRPAERGAGEAAQPQRRGDRLQLRRLRMDAPAHHPVSRADGEPAGGEAAQELG